MAMDYRHSYALGEMASAVNASDAARYAMLYAPDAVLTIHGNGEFRGRAAIEQHERELMREFPGTRFAFHSIWQKGHHAAAHYAVRARTQPAGRWDTRACSSTVFIPPG